MVVMHRNMVQVGPGLSFKLGSKFLSRVRPGFESIATERIK